MTTYKSLYESNDSNGSLIDVSPAYATLFNSLFDRQRKVEFKSSFNYLEIINNSDNDIKIRLDNLSTRERLLFGKSIIVIKAEENIFFDTVQIINTSASVQISANAISAIARIMQENP